MGSNRIFLEQIDQSGASGNYVIAWNGSSWAPIVASSAVEDNGVTLAKLAQVATGTFLGRTSASTGNVEALTIAQAKALLALTKSDVGLANVDNTSDANKPISTATQAALDAKQGLDATLTALAALSWSTGTQIPVFTAADTVSFLSVGQAAGNILNKAAGDALYQPVGSYLTGNQTITLSGDISGSGATAITTAIGSNKVTLGMLAQVNTGVFLGRNTAGTGNVEPMTATEATSKLDIFTTTAKGMVPSPGSATGKFLKDNGTWDTVSTGSASFIDLTDSDPTTYTGHAGKAVIVNSTPNGLTFSSSALGSAAYAATTAFAAASHTHVIADVTGLQTALNNKVDDTQISAFALTLLDDLTAEDMQATLLLGSAATADAAAFAEAIHTHAQSDITGLTTTLSGKEPTINAGTTAQYWRGDKSWQALNKAAVGLANVDNTSDANKPISTATQTALDLKAPLANPTFTGTVTLPGDPTNPLHAATKQYVDGVAQGLDVKASVLVATTGNITLSGEQTIDNVATSASRVLVRAQTSSSQNGIYVTASGAWTRATDMDAWAEVPGAFVFVEQGNTYADTGWVCTSDAGGTLGTNNIIWTQFSGAGTYTSSGGITLTGTNFALTNMAANTLKGNNTGGAAAPIDLTGAQATALLSEFTGATSSVAGVKGLVTQPLAGDEGKFLKGDGTWAVVAPLTDGDKGDITVSASGANWSIDNNVVSLAKMAQVATATFLGRTSASTGNVEALTTAQATALLNTFTATLKGLVPPPTTSTGKYLKDDGTWDSPSAGGASPWAGTVTATGTGASQNITLPEADLAPQDVMVFVDGIRWETDEYNISGTTLTLTTNLAGESVEIMKPTGAGGSTVHTPVIYNANISGNVTVDCHGRDVLRLTLVGNVTDLQLSNMVDGKKLSIEFIQDATGGRTIALNSQFKFGTDFPSYTPTTVANKRDLIGLWVTGSNVYVVGIAKGYS